MAFTGLWTRPEKLWPTDNYFHQFPALSQTQSETEFPSKGEREGATRRKKVTDVEHQGRHEASN